MASANQPVTLLEQARQTARAAEECLGFDAARMPRAQGQTDQIADANLALEGLLPQDPPPLAEGATSTVEASPGLAQTQAPAGFRKKAV